MAGSAHKKRQMTPSGSLDAFVSNLESFLGEDDEGLKGRTGGRNLALLFDEGPILFGVHFQSTPAQ